MTTASTDSAATSKLSFKDRHTFEERKEQARQVREKYSDRSILSNLLLVPVICEKAQTRSEADTADIDKNKFLVPGDLTIGQFLYVIRKRIDLRPQQSLFLYAKPPHTKRPVLPSTAMLLVSAYNEYKDEDGFLYLIYSTHDFYGE